MAETRKHDNTEGVRLRRMEVDFFSPLEIFLSGSIFAAVIAGIAVYFSLKNLPEHLEFFPLSRAEHISALIALGLTVAVFFVLSNMYSVYYVADAETRKLLLCRKFLGWEWLSAVAPFSAFVAVTVAGRLKTDNNKNRNRWEYRCVLVPKKRGPVRKVIPVTSWGWDFEEPSEEGARLARLMRIRFKPGKKKRLTKFKREKTGRNGRRRRSAKITIEQQRRSEFFHLDTSFIVIWTIIFLVSLFFIIIYMSPEY